MKETERLYDLIYAVVTEIPKGCVATYGQIARLIGKDRHARLVGRALKYADFYGHFPCHRVVDHNGRLTPGWDEQRSLLEKEGIPFKDAHHVDLKRCQWKC